MTIKYAYHGSLLEPVIKGRGLNASLVFLNHHSFEGQSENDAYDYISIGIEDNELVLPSNETVTFSGRDSRGNIISVTGRYSLMYDGPAKDEPRHALFSAIEPYTVEESE